jgi:formamidopyrimidine-DNA glycosylase
MPELPEVETHVRDLAPLLQDHQVVGAQIFWPRTIAEPSPEGFAQRIVGQRFVRFSRRGKYMLLEMDSGDTLIIHLRMTGHLRVEPAESLPDKHVHVLLDLDDGRRLLFQDARKFGRLWLVADPAPVLAGLGPEPLAAEFPIHELAAKLAGRKAPIKALLLDQRLLAGVGNIYADEALHLAGIHPARPAGTLTLEELSRLFAAIRTVLAAAIEDGGSSLGDSSVTNYLRPNGAPGNYRSAHGVYDRKGQPCFRCGAPIERIVLAQRSAHFCPVCQPLTGVAQLEA